MNNITKILEVLGEKIAALESELHYKSILLEEANKKLEEYRAMMGSTSAEPDESKEW